MKCIRTGFQNRIEYTTARATHFGIVGIGLDLDFRHCFYRRDDDRPTLPVADWHSIDEEVVLPY